MAEIEGFGRTIMVCLVWGPRLLTGYSRDVILAPAFAEGKPTVVVGFQGAPTCKQYSRETCLFS